MARLRVERSGKSEANETKRRNRGGEQCLSFTNHKAHD
jgi:hypothetical protein